MAETSEIDFASLEPTLLDRISTRTYGTVYPTADQVTAINTFIAKINSMNAPYNKPCKFALQMEDFSSFRTFGFITGSKYWIFGVTGKNDRNSDLSYGYLMHLIILECTRLGLKTVWLGGTFTTSVFTAIQYNSSTDYIPCVSPVGNSGNGSELISKMAGSRKRKELSEIIYIGNAETKYSKENAPEKFTLKILEEIRFAPSASNKQEWRIVISENKMHFFGIKGSWTALDMGICTAQAQVALAGNKVEGKFEIEKPEIGVPGDWEYFITFTATN